MPLIVCGRTPGADDDGSVAGKLKYSRKRAKLISWQHQRFGCNQSESWETLFRQPDSKVSQTLFFNYFYHRIFQFLLVIHNYIFIDDTHLLQQNDMNIYNATH